MGREMLGLVFTVTVSIATVSAVKSFTVVVFTVDVFTVVVFIVVAFIVVAFIAAFFAFVSFFAPHSSSSAAGPFFAVPLFADQPPELQLFSAGLEPFAPQSMLFVD